MMIAVPDGRAIELKCRAMYRRVLGAWVSDMLELRRRGLDEPAYRAAAALDEGGDERFVAEDDR
jgi:hypothetical protein